MDMYKFTVENYKCFKEKVTIDKPSLVNLIIGRNNSGKSSLLDCISVICSNKNNKDFDNSKFNISFPINNTIVKQNYRETSYSHFVYGPHHEPLTDFQAFNILKLQDIVVSSKVENGILQFSKAPIELQNIDYQNSFIEETDAQWISCAKSHFIDKQLYAIHKISAERDIKPEGQSSSLNLSSNGDGVTTLIDTYLHQKGFNYKIIKETLF